MTKSPDSAWNCEEMWRFAKVIFWAWLVWIGQISQASREKRAEIDLQTCIDNFDIHKDKIIRTQDSRAMGAKYLNEIDLDSRVECLRLCCETENCDVFVYEEKVKEKSFGNCFLCVLIVFVSLQVYHELRTNKLQV